jgi:hypothetical protein
MAAQASASELNMSFHRQRHRGVDRDARRLTILEILVFEPVECPPDRSRLFHGPSGIETGLSGTYGGARVVL